MCLLGSGYTRSWEAKESAGKLPRGLVQEQAMWNWRTMAAEKRNSTLPPACLYQQLNSQLNVTYKPTLSDPGVFRIF